MPQTWLDPQTVADRLGLPLPDEKISSATSAAAAYVERIRDDLRDSSNGTYAPTPDVLEGSILFAAHVYQLRQAPGGFAAYGDSLGDFTPATVMPSLVQRLINVKRPLTA